MLLSSYLHHPLQAWAKVHLSYEATAGGHTFDAHQYLTAGVVSDMPLDSDLNDKCVPPHSRCQKRRAETLTSESACIGEVRANRGF